MTTANVIEFYPPDDGDPALLDPVLGEIARFFRDVHPHDLETAEVFELLSVINRITGRLDGERSAGHA